VIPKQQHLPAAIKTGRPLDPPLHSCGGPARTPESADVFGLGRLVTRVCAMTSAVVARLIY
jgi:hypothetical protein